MERSVIPSHEDSEKRHRSSDARQGRARAFSPGLRSRAILAGILAAALLTVLIGLDSRGFDWFDPTLIGYTVATIFATAAVTYKYAFWLALVSFLGFALSLLIALWPRQRIEDS